MKKETFKKQFIQVLNKFSQKKNISTLFFDFCHLSACSMSNSVDRANYVLREDTYLKIISKYDKTEAGYFPELLNIVIRALEHDPFDFLGYVYMDLNISNKQAGQFFTPSSVSDLMARLTWSNTDDTKLEKDGFIELNDPCVGAGTMVISFANLLKTKGHNYQTKLRVTCSDIDSNVLAMTYVQFSLLGIDAVCLLGDSLTMEFTSTWITPLYYLNRAKEDHLQKLKKVHSLTEAPVLKTFEQLDLF